MRMACTNCGGEGRLYQSRYGGNDPDVWDAGECPVCHGTADEPCSRFKCDEAAVGENADGEPMCQHCLDVWNAEIGVA